MNFKVGIIGGGRIGYVHSNAINKFVDNAQVVAIADAYLSKENKEKFEKLGIKTFYTDYKEMLQNPDIDVIYICSPTDTHHTYSIEALEAGKHVFCEKPVAFDLDKILEVEKVVKKTKKHFTVGHNRRFDHNFLALKEAILNETVGKIVQLRVTSRDPGLPPYEYIKKSGGIFLDMMIHDLDMVLFLTNKKVESIYATGSALIDPEIKNLDDIDTAVVVLNFEDGSMATIENCRQTSYGYDQRVEIHGTKANIKIENDTNSTLIISSDQGVAKEKPLYFFLERYHNAYIKENKDFFEAIALKNEVKVSIQDGYNAVLLAKAATKSLKEKRVVKISEFLK
ncbi:inositol 2-dehydrogenase [Mycoplasma hyorhinis]|uniref:inositol 2-dehydrogenase n=1 Tax=Mesomycoplasma hyorhinis TaxID=2100 RepID=UPI00137170D8|nr:inositol 2-dehydrogenase [Mesomycoplasma hyorhinis]MXR07532.1 inositol 2-dehydrogenase [Mesomycoplasma hyorhinis]